jgi:DNA-binding response OmpR family regulator
MTTDATPVVLVADDEPSMLALVGQHIKTMGYEVLEASDGEQAWALAQEHLPDLVILDVMMPGMSGWEVCRKIREDVALAHTAIIMLTGIGENLNELTSPLYGADSYIDKPFAFPELDEKVRGALSKRQASRPGLARTAPGEGLELVRNGNGNGNGNGGHHDHGHGLLASTGTETESEPPHAEAVDEAWSDHEEGSEVTNGADETIMLVETSSLRTPSRRQHAGKPPSRNMAARGAHKPARAKAKSAPKGRAKPVQGAAKAKGKAGSPAMKSKGKAKPVAAKAKPVVAAKSKMAKGAKTKGTKGSVVKTVAKAVKAVAKAVKVVAKKTANKKIIAKPAVKKPVARAKSAPRVAARPPASKAKAKSAPKATARRR